MPRRARPGAFLAVLGAFWGPLLAGCLPALPHTEPQATPSFDAVAFFSGRTAGLGTLAIRGRAPVVVRVESVGTVRPDGSLDLRQLVRRGDGPPSERAWSLRPTGPGRYVGTLTDASGEVEAWEEGNHLRIRYPMGWATSVRQDLTLEPGGQLALNLMTVRFLGIPIARLTEQIRRVDGEDRLPRDPSGRP